MIILVTTQTFDVPHPPIVQSGPNQAVGSLVLTNEEAIDFDCVTVLAGCRMKVMYLECVQLRSGLLRRSWTHVLDVANCEAEAGLWCSSAGSREFIARHD